MKKYSSFALAALVVSVLAMSGASEVSAVQTFSGRCTDDPVLVQSSSGQKTLCSDLFARSCPNGTLTSKTDLGGSTFEITCTLNTGQSDAGTCDPTLGSCAAGTIAPDGRTNLGGDGGTSTSDCNPAIESCVSGTTKTSTACDPKKGNCDTVDTSGTGSGSGSGSASGSGSGGSGSGSAPGGANVKLLNPLGTTGSNGLEAFLGSILDFVIRIGTVVVVLMMVYVGFKFVTAQGDPGEITKAREMLLWTVVGALVLLGSKVLASGIEATVKALSVGG